MRFDAKALALAIGVITVVLWTLCSGFVAMAPGPAKGITGHMVHADMSGFSWALTWGGFLVGLVSWTISAAVTAWLVASTYNRLASSKAT